MHFNKTVECSYLIAPVLIVLKRSILRSRSMILHKLTSYMELLAVFGTPIVCPPFNMYLPVKPRSAMNLMLFPYSLYLLTVQYLL